VRVVVVGASAAGIAACNGLRTAGFDGEIILVGDETHPPYDRPPLSKQLLRGAVESDGIGFAGARTLADRGVIHRRGSRATGLDQDRAVVEIEGGEELSFDGLVVATGSTPRRLPGQPKASGVHALRTLDDALALRGELAGARSLAVVGAGFIGLEIASTARSLGVATTVIESAPAPLARVLGTDLGARFSELHMSHGVDVRCGVAVTGLRVADDRVTGVELDGERPIDADVVVVGVGAAAATDWLLGSGLTVDDGVVCDPSLRAAPRIYAAGDVARWEHPRFGSIRVEHWMTAIEHGRGAARNLAAELAGRAGEVKPVESVPAFWSDQYDVKVQMVGWPSGYDEIHEVPQGETGHGVLLGREGRLVAVLGWNAPAFVARRRQAVATGSPLAEELEVAIASVP
jgi:3-phenylpropionate/trans-cinnamate dioxygenase ferredoxin reductase component